MEVITRVFGDITIDDDKIIIFPGGLVGFPELTEFALVHDVDKGLASIHWLQSLQETDFALPVLDPLIVLPEYNPEVNDELLQGIGELDPQEMLVLVTVTVPRDIRQMSVNLKGPIIVNAAVRKACQVIVEGEEYSVKFPIYDILNDKKAGE